VTREAFRHALRKLAELHGLQPSYRDVSGQMHHAGDETLLRILGCLGVPVHAPADVADALTSAEITCWDRTCDPVVVARGKKRASLRLRFERAAASRRFRVHIALEGGGHRVIEGRAAGLPSIGRHDLDGRRFVEKRLDIDAPLPPGYHHARIEIGGASDETLLLCAPRRAWGPGSPTWGVFAPVYALRRERSLGAGDLTDLEDLLSWVSAQGGSLVGTLPLLAAFLDEPFDPSPYAPASRLFWNELYVDLDRLPGLSDCRPARELLASTAYAEESARLRADPLVDYRSLMALKRRVLEELARSFFASAKVADLEAFIASRPGVEDYARFRAVLDTMRMPWTRWPEPLRSGRIEPADYREDDRRYHLYAQWRVSQQMAAVANKGRSAGLGIYLDLPLGVHPAGYDVWRERESFIDECSLGAPPDVVFTQGQQWNIAPLNPQALRKQRYRYFIGCIRHHLRCAGALRIDHVMGLHRAWCIPPGVPASDGVYLTYPHDEIYAILALESRRARSLLVGEDLGTVPRGVRSAMHQNGLFRMHVLQYELESATRDPLAKVTRGTMASVNTHDMSPFAAWWKALDIDDRRARGLLDADGAASARAERQRSRALVLRRLRAKPRARDADVLAGVLREYARSPASVLLVNLEDLWLEREPQNVPGTDAERPNWRRKLRHPLPAIRKLERVRDVLRRVQAARRAAASRSR